MIVFRSLEGLKSASRRGCVQVSRGLVEVHCVQVSRGLVEVDVFKSLEGL